MRISDLPMLSEIKDEYIQLRQRGKNRTDATQVLIQNYINELTTGAEEDGLLFWIGLADAQYHRKELTSDVAQKALWALKQLELLNWNITPGDINRRKIRYEAAPMPERKVGKSTKFRCTWQIGDTFAYQLSGQDTDACGLSGKYVLLRKVDELEFGDGRLLPVVTVTMWDDKELPRNTEEFQRLPILILENGRLGSSHDLYEYRVELLISNTRSLSRIPLTYLGNFADVQMPSDELIINDPGMITMVSLERLDRRLCSFWKRHNQCIEHR